MTKNKVILMDVDGVLLDLFPPAAEYVLEKHGVTITPSMITHWDWDYALGIPVMCHGFWDYVWNSELKPYHGAVEFIATLKMMGFTVIAASNRVSQAAQENAVRQFPALKFDNYILVSEYMDKLKIAKDIDARLSLEDNPKTAAALGASKDDLESYLINRPLNQFAKAITGSYERVYSYEGFIRKVNEWQERN